MEAKTNASVACNCNALSNAGIFDVKMALETKYRREG